MRFWMSSSRIGGLVIVVAWYGLPVHLISHHVIFFMGIHQVEVYRTKPRDLPTLGECIRNACNSVTPEMLSEVGRARVKRRLDCSEKGSAHFELYH